MELSELIESVDIHDGDNVDLQLCCDCFDKLVSECNVSPIEEVDDE